MFCCNSPFDQNLVFFKLFVLKPKTFMLNKKTQLKIRKKTKIRKRDLKGKTRQETIKKRKIDEKINCNLKFSCCSFQKTKAKKKEKWKRDKNKKQQESDKERQEGRKKDKSKRETEKEKQKKGRSKKVEGERKRNTENKQKMPFLGGKRFFY